jgi:hypothetical protein
MSRVRLGCGHKKVRQHENPILLYIFGGIVFAMIYMLSRESRFECAQCGKRFFSHTNTSRVFQVVWLLVCAIVICVAGYLIISAIRPK